MAQVQAGLKKKSRLRKFCESFFVWLAGIVVSAVPIFFKHLNFVLNNKSSNEYDLFRMTLSDFEFSYIIVSILFVLCLEGCLLNDEVPRWYGVFRVCTVLCLFVTWGVYCISFFFRDQFSYVWPITQFRYNMITLGAAIAFGVVCHIGISLREGGTT